MKIILYVSTSAHVHAPPAGPMATMLSAVISTIARAQDDGLTQPKMFWRRQQWGLARESNEARGPKRNVRARNAISCTV